MTDEEAIDRPPHYTFSPVEVISAIEAWSLGFHLGNVVKYGARAAHKRQRLPDLKKARWYLDREIARLEQKLDGSPQTNLPEVR